MNISISQFKIDFYDEVFALWQQCEGVGLSDADSYDSIQTYLNRNPGMSFIAKTDSRIVGAILSGHDGRRGYIHHLTIHPHYRRKNIGYTLVDHCLATLADQGIKKCHLFIFNDNENGIAFWKAAGWTPRSDIHLISKNIT